MLLYSENSLKALEWSGFTQAAPDVYRLQFTQSVLALKLQQLSNKLFNCDHLNKCVHLNKYYEFSN